MKRNMRVVAAISACALTIGGAAPAMAHGGKNNNHHGNKDNKTKIVNVQTNVTIINQQAIAVNLGSGSASATNVALVEQTNR
jgi:hypothetical protein